MCVSLSRAYEQGMYEMDDITGESNQETGWFLVMYSPAKSDAA